MTGGMALVTWLGGKVQEGAGMWGVAWFCCLVTVAGVVLTALGIDEPDAAMDAGP
jgi:hypothetical protein